VASANQALTYINGGSAVAADNQSVHATIALTTSTGANFAVYAPPASKQYTIYNASSYTATIYNSTVIGNTTIAVDLRSGRRLWERSFGGGSGPAGAGDWIFSVTRGGRALALGREDGRIRWVTDLDPPPAEGAPLPPARFGRAMIAGGHVIVPSSRGELLLLAPSGGAILGRVQLGHGVTLPMAAAGGMLVALADDGTLIALR
jgi:outer membrane protein assembly factor BamB